MRPGDRELDDRAPLFDGRRLVSIYFGGGTPGCGGRIASGRGSRAIRARSARDELEVTRRGQPRRSAARAARRACRRRRQSALARRAVARARAPARRSGARTAPSEARRAVADARAAGFANLSLDLMFGLPVADADRARVRSRRAARLEPEHVSVYNLTIEERTPFGGCSAPASAGARLRRLRGDVRAHRRAPRRRRLGHYEISSWARPGRRAVHNTLYWTGGEYLGLGCSAHSFRRLPGGGGERFSVARSVDEWLRAPTLASSETLDAAALEREACGSAYVSSTDRSRGARARTRRRPRRRARSGSLPPRRRRARRRHARTAATDAARRAVCRRRRRAVRVNAAIYKVGNVGI